MTPAVAEQLRTGERRYRSIADLHAALGRIPLDRISMDPPPGTATKADLLLLGRFGGFRPFHELVEGTLVAKTAGWNKGRMTPMLAYAFGKYLTERPIARMTGAGGPYETIDGRVRCPDFAVVLNARILEADAAEDDILPIAPDLAVEVILEGNTPEEGVILLREYFAAGVRLVWYVDPRKRSVRVFTSPTDVRELTEDDTLDGGDVLPGFELSIREWFERAEVQG